MQDMLSATSPQVPPQTQGRPSGEHQKRKTQEGSRPSQRFVHASAKVALTWGGADSQAATADLHLSSSLQSPLLLAVRANCWAVILKLLSLVTTLGPHHDEI